MHPLASAILITWRRNRAYALRLVSDLAPEQFVAQPAGLPPHIIMNHPAWILAHLSVYAPNCTAMLRRTPFADPIDHPFGQRSKVSPDAATYPAVADLVEVYSRTHDEAEAALVQTGESDAAVFALANPLERWRVTQPTIGDMLVTLMVKHESGHLGQLSAWRRAMGLASVGM